MYVSLQIIIKKYYFSNLYKTLNGLIIIPLFNLYNNNINNNQALMPKFWDQLWILTNQSRSIACILSYCFIIFKIILLIKSLICQCYILTIFCMQQKKQGPNPKPPLLSLYMMIGIRNHPMMRPKPWRSIKYKLPSSAKSISYSPW